MATIGITTQASRFALLQVDDDDLSDEEQNSKHQKESNTDFQLVGGAKKRNKKKKKSETAAAKTNELRNIAFGKPKHGKARGGPPSGQGKGAGEGLSDKQWEEWKKLDNEYTKDAYEQDLEQALLLSKIEFEHDKEVRSMIKEEDVVLHVQDGKSRRKKKKKDKPSTMSLDQFTKVVEQLDSAKSKPVVNLDDSDSESEELPPPPPEPKLPSESDPTFFDRVDADVSRIINKEKMQEEYKKQYAMESVRSQQYEEQLRKKDKEITFLRATSKKLQQELKQVKERNQGLCHILSQGEMKAKSAVLLELEELKNVRDELTEEVTNLTTELEKERSKVHALKSEVEKLKGGKHAK